MIRWIQVICLLCFIMLSFSAHSTNIQPTFLDMTAVGRQSSAFLRIANSAARPVPVEIVVSHLELGPNGEQHIEPGGDEDFLIFPPQALVGPNATQVFRIQWLGEPDIAESRSYIFSVNQLPVQLPEGITGIQLLYSFSVLVTVAPGDGSPDLELADASLVRDDDGDLRPKISLVNHSNVHGYLSRSQLSLVARSQDGSTVWSETLTPEQIGTRVGLGLMQPGALRHFTLPFSIGPEASTLEVDFRYVDRRR